MDLSLRTSARNMDPLEQIPFTFVSTVVKASLARKLDIFDRTGKDWRGLADCLDFTADEIDHMNALTHNGSNTEKLFENYIRSDGHNVGQVLSSLKELGREDAFKILYDSLPDIIAKYQKKTGRTLNAMPRQSSFGSPTDNREQPGYPVTSVPPMYQPVQNMPYGNPALRHISAPVFAQATNGLPGQNWNIPLQTNQIIYDSPRNDSRLITSMIPHAHNNGSFRAEDVEMNELSTTSYDSAGHVHRTDSAPLSFIEGMARGQNQLLSGQSEFGSLAPGTPVQMFKSGGFFGHDKGGAGSPGSSRSEDPDLQENTPSMDDATRRRVEEWLVNVSPSQTDEPKQLTNHQRSSNSNTQRPSSATGKHKLSQSDENGGPSNKKLSSFRDNVKRSKTSSRTFAHLGRHGLSRNRDNMEPLREHGRNTPHSTGHSFDPSPVSVRLESLESEQCNSLTGFVSDPIPARPSCAPHPLKESKHHSWPETKTEELLRRSKDYDQLSTQIVQQVPSPHPNVTHTQMELLQKRSRPNSQSPAPVVVNVQGQSEEVEMQSGGEVELISRQIKAMSVSMPKGLKPAPHIEAKRNIRVFITYSQDDKKHIQRVINLCDCLRKNNFQPCIDMFEKRKIAQDKHEWIDKKFKEADFVFVVISPLYKRDADRSRQFENGEQISYHGLHTRYIYRLMQNEYTNNMCKNYRFVPLIFQTSGATMEHVPEWLKNTLIYSWPRQYKDLFFHIQSSSKQNAIAE